MADETGLAITRAFYVKITEDATMQTVLGTPVALYRIMAPPDPDMPYLVHRLSLGSPLLHGSHTYLLDVWDCAALANSYSPSRVDAAVDRLKILLHFWRFTTASSEIGAGIMEWFSGGYIPTDANNVFHYATQWTIRFGAARDITNIVEV